MSFSSTIKRNLKLVSSPLVWFFENIAILISFYPLALSWLSFILHSQFWNDLTGSSFMCALHLLDYGQLQMSDSWLLRGLFPCLVIVILLLFSHLGVVHNFVFLALMAEHIVNIFQTCFIITFGKWASRTVSFKYLTFVSRIYWEIKMSKTMKLARAERLGNLKCWIHGYYSRFM